jgi:prepilin-type N-terminal cleavage/methylation domain-containing protein/prepilin-type processing-associated H-X9-DG protein
MLQRNKAFTLIELLVVVSIIALLVSIMMPALAAAREQAQRAVDLSHIRGMTTAWVLYADDNDDKLMPGKTRPVHNFGTVTAPNFDFATDAMVDSSGHTTFPGGTFCWNVFKHQNKWSYYYGGRTWIGFQGIAIPGNPTTEEIMGREATVTVGLMYQYVEDTEVFKCPTINDPMQKSTYNFVDAMNGHDCFPEANGAVVYTQVSQIPSPSGRVVLLCEGMQTGGQSCAVFHLGNFSLYASPPVLLGTWDYWPCPHNNGSVFSFADGHAEYHQWEDPRTVPDSSGISCHPNPNPMSGNLDAIWIAQYCWGITIK